MSDRPRFTPERVQCLLLRLPSQHCQVDVPEAHDRRPRPEPTIDRQDSAHEWLQAFKRLRARRTRHGLLH